MSEFEYHLQSLEETLPQIAFHLGDVAAVANSIPHWDEIKDTYLVPKKERK